MWLKMDTFDDSSDKASMLVDLANDLSAKISAIVDGFDVDTASDADIDAKFSLIAPLEADYLSKIPFFSGDYVNFLAENPWLPMALFCTSSVILTRDMKRFALVTRDDQWHEEYAAGNAIIQSFEQVIEQFCHPGSHLNFDMNEPSRSLCTKVLTHFRHFCKQLSTQNCSYVPHIVTVITEAAEIAEDVLTLVVDQIHLPEDGLDIDLWSIARLEIFLRGRYFPPVTHNRIPEDDLEVLNDNLVGVHVDMKKIKEQLLSPVDQLEIIPIIGMGGIGKTTLATIVYEDPEIKRHFHIRAWTAVSQNYQKRDVLLRLLQSITPFDDQETSKESCEKLGELLCRRLRGRKFLAVVDDIWATEDWDDIKQWFPDDNNCSRIVLTSRLTEVGVYANPDNLPHSMNCLGAEDSWNLLCKKLFLKEACPPELVNVGLQIVEKCQGLPLAIIVIAGHLSKMSTTPDHWENVANGVGSLKDETLEQVLNILSLSYNSLPQDLKACFLYMGTFPKNSDIPVQKLIRLWTAVGFLQEEKSNGVEEMAEKHLKDLISRNLIAVKRRTCDGRVKICAIHDLLWDLCLIKARQDGDHIFGPCLVKHTNDDMKYLMSLTSTSLFFDPSLKSKFHLSSVGFKDLRVLDVLFQTFIYFPDEITELVNLRYLALSTYGRIPGSVSKLCHLETLINDHRWACPVLPEEIWLLPCLKHLHVGTCAFFGDPSILPVTESCLLALLDLQTLSSISSTSCTKDVFLRIPNVKQLEIHEIRKEFLGDELLFNCLTNLVYLRELQKLKLKCSSAKLQKPRCIPPWIDFVPNIKQLTLVESHLEWKEMNDLAMLPNLEVLKLKKGAFRGKKWEQLLAFPQLKFLLLQSLGVGHWKANKDHFPNLQRLVIKNCSSLYNIPNDLGEIATLQSISIDSCAVSIVSPTVKAQMEQLEMGNDEFSIRVGYVPIEHRLAWLAVIFIYMTLRLKKQMGEQDSSCAKQKRNKSLLGKLWREVWSQREFIH